VDIPKRKPEQTAARSKATALYAFNLSWTIAAVEGASRSGVAVATIISSISFGDNPAFSIALSPALLAKSLVVWSGKAILRSLIPRLSSIHLAFVGTIV